MKIKDALSKSYEILKNVNIDTYVIDSELLLCKVLKKDKLFLFMNRDFDIDLNSEKQFFKYINMRKNKMPVKYILKQCEFMGMDFFIKEGVLIPRPDTEILVEKVIEIIKKNNFNSVYDVCCGSGVIGLSIAYLSKVKNVLCSDISNIALDVTKKNIEKFKLDNKVKCVESDLIDFAIDNNLKFDVVVSNPPYIEKDTIETLMDDVKNYEPYIALCGGYDGLDFYKKIIKDSKKILNENGILAFEIGYNQREKVENLMKENGFSNIESFKDLAGLDRVVVGKFIVNNL